VESSQRALERRAIVHAKLKRGLADLPPSFHGPVHRLLAPSSESSTPSSHRHAEDSGIGAVAGGISEALVTTAFGLFVAIPAVMTFNFFTNKVEAFDVEMDNSSSELVDYFIKQSHR